MDSGSGRTPKGAAGSFIGAGTTNLISSNGSFVGAGMGNSISSDAFNSFVGSGDFNMVSEYESFVGAGDGNSVSADDSFVGAGEDNSTSAVWSFVGAGLGNSASSNESFVGAGRYNTVEASDAFVGSGENNTIDSPYSVIGGGYHNSISGEYGFIGSGEKNSVSGLYGAIIGGYGNVASGSYAVVAGGDANTAAGTLSLAGGYHADATHNGSFVWSDYSTGSAVVKDAAVNQFVVRASGGVTFYSNEGMTSGVKLGAGSGTFASLSDRNVKTGIVPLDDDAILAKVSALPVSAWSYRSERGVRHVGPMAQDFYAAFGMGEDDRHITPIDEDGVALAAIKALHREVSMLRADATRKDAQLSRLNAAVARLMAREK